MRRTYTRALHLNKLHGELLLAGIVPSYLGGTDSYCEMDVPDATDPSVVDTVVAAHDPTTPSAAEQQVSADTTTLDSLAQQYQTFKDGLTTIRGHMDTILAGPASPTAAQTGSALKSIAGDIKTMCNGLDALLDDVRVFVRRGGTP